MDQLRWGVIGPGRIAPRIVRALASSSRGALVAVASRDLDRARAFAATFGVGQSFGSYEALIRSPEVDVVYVSLPNHLHAEWTVRALEAGKHVLCEKPLALTVDDVDRITEAAQRAGRIAAEGFMYLHHRRRSERWSSRETAAWAGSSSCEAPSPSSSPTRTTRAPTQRWAAGRCGTSAATRSASPEPSPGRSPRRSEPSRASTSGTSIAPSSVSCGSRMDSWPNSTADSPHPTASRSRSSATTPPSCWMRPSCLSPMAPHPRSACGAADPGRNRSPLRGPVPPRSRGPDVGDPRWHDPALDVGLHPRQCRHPCRPRPSRPGSCPPCAVRMREPLRDG